LKRTTLFLLFAVSSLIMLGAEPMEVRRFGLFIGANQGGMERQPLVYADDDARKMMMTMEQIGGIDSSDSLLLLDPSSSKVLEALKILSLQISEVDRLVRRTEIMFYYSGHSNEQGILLSDEELSYKLIRESLDLVGADVVIAVLDSCSSGAFTRLKGGERRSPFLIDESSNMEGHAFLTSSSETEFSQESDLISGSYFTYNLITGLRGAADNTGDNRVSLNEVYEHTFRETLSSTESTIGGPQHATYEIQLTGTGDLVLTDLTIPTSALLISGELSGHFSIRTEREEKLVAEFSKFREETFKLALPAGEYEVSMTDEEDISTAHVALSRNGQFYLTKEDFSSRKLTWARFRGDTLRAEENKVPFALSLFPDLNYPVVPLESVLTLQIGLSAFSPRLAGLQTNLFFNVTERDSIGVQASSLFNEAHNNFLGLQTAGLYNRAGEDMQGIQGAGLCNFVGGSLEGVQLSVMFNVAGDELSGIQGAGLFNIAGRPSSGLQFAGAVNIAGELEGAQIAGLYNSTDYINGLQLGLINRAGTMKGLQLGVVNISNEMNGAALGLVNLSKNGIVDGGFWFEADDVARLYTFFQSGTPRFYTLYFMGNEMDHYLRSTDELVLGAHLGSRLSLGNFNFDIDGGLRTSYRDLEEYGDEELAFLPSFRAVCALEGLGFFCGVSAVSSYPGAFDYSLGGDGFALFGNENFTLYSHFILGYRF
jgi:hypothetical protein